MTNQEFIELCVKANASLKNRFRTHSAEVLLEEIIRMVREKGD